MKLKLTAFILLIFSVYSFSQEISSFTTRLGQIEILLSANTTSIDGLNEVADFSVVNTSLEDLLRTISQSHSINLSLSGDLSELVTNNFTNVEVKDLLYFICKRYHLNLSLINNSSFAPL